MSATPYSEDSSDRPRVPPAQVHESIARPTVYQRPSEVGFGVLGHHVDHAPGGERVVVNDVDDLAATSYPEMDVLVPQPVGSDRSGGVAVTPVTVALIPQPRREAGRAGTEYGRRER